MYYICVTIIVEILVNVKLINIFYMAKYLLFGERLRELRKKRGLSQDKLVDMLNKEADASFKRSTISNYETGFSMPSLDVIPTFVKILDTTSDYLLGVSDVEGNVEGNVEVIPKYPLESYRKNLYKVEESKPKSYPMKEAVMVTVDNLGHDNIAYVPVKAQAGYLTGYKDKEYFEKLPAFALPGFKNDVYRAFEVSGYSMLPAEGVGLYPGDIIIAAFLDHPHKIRDSRVYVIVCDAPEVDNIIVKRCLNRLEANNKIICFSDNKNGDYPAIILEPDQIKEIWEFKAKISRHIPPPGSIFDQLNDLSGRLVIVEEKLKQNKLNKYHNSNDD